MFAMLANRTAVEQPVLWLGLAGFGPAQRRALEAALPRSSRLPQWRVCELSDADAWWVNGRNLRLLPNGNLYVSPGLPAEQALEFSLGEVRQHLAVAGPHSLPDNERLASFDLASPAGIQAALLALDTSLRLERAQFVLGSHIVQRGVQLRHGIFHVCRDGKFLAVLDFVRGKAGFALDIHPVDVWDAEWHRRPMGAGDAPDNFVSATIAELAWAYLRRTDRDLLPARYRSALLYFRQPPRVPVRLLRDSQLLLLRELACAPATMESVGRRIGLSGPALAHDLSCLYYAGAITTTRAKASGGAGFAGEDEAAISRPGPLSSLLEDREAAHLRDDFTAPALRLRTDAAGQRSAAHSLN